jgi:hypothetical protein
VTRFIKRLRAATKGLPEGEVIQVTAPVDEIRAHLERLGSGAGAEWSLSDLAERFDCAPGTMAKWCKRGVFKGVWQDEAGRWHVPDTAVQTYIRTKQKEAAARAAELQQGKELASQRRRAGAPERIPNPPRTDIAAWKKKVRQT